MKIISMIFLVILVCSCTKVSENTSKEEAAVYKLHTIAISVSNLQESMDWYSRNLGFKLIQRRDFPENEIKTSIIGGVGFRLELIEQKGSVSQYSHLNGEAQPNLIQGFKKIVFTVTNVDSLYSSLKNNRVNFVYPEIKETKGVWGRWFMFEDPDKNIIQCIDGKL